MVAFGSSGSCVLFFMPIMKNLSFLDWSVLILIVWNACFRGVLSFCIFFRNGWTEFTLLYPKKNMYLLWNWSFRFMSDRLIVTQLFWQRITKLLERTSKKVWENCWGLESSSLNGSTASVPEIAVDRQNYRKVDHFATRLFGIFQKLWPFYPERLSQK